MDDSISAASTQRYQRLPSRTEVARADQPHAPGITRVSHTHEAILQFMIAQPDAALGEVAAHFGYTQPWLSNIIYSDCFQAKLAEAQADIFGEVKTTVKDRLTTLAHRSLSRLAEKIEVEQDVARITDAAELALKAMGFMGQSNGRPAPGAVGGNIFNTQVNIQAPVDRATLAAARAMMEGRQPLRLVHDAETAVAVEPPTE